MSSQNPLPRSSRSIEKILGGEIDIQSLPIATLKFSFSERGTNFMCVTIHGTEKKYQVTCGIKMNGTMVNGRNGSNKPKILREKKAKPKIRNHPILLMKEEIAAMTKESKTRFDKLGKVFLNSP